MSADLRQTKPLSSLVKGILSAFPVGEVKHDAKKPNRRTRIIVEKPAEWRQPEAFLARLRDLPIIGGTP